MGIRDELQADIAEAFDAADELADAVNPFTGSHFVRTGYDPLTEQVTGTELNYTGRGVLAAYALNRIDGVNILHGDLKLIALTNEVTAEPAVGHSITTKDLVSGLQQEYSVISVKTDPARAAYTIQVRRK